uniref:Tyrosine-protein kinase n=1 Tax=Plectus sambesii TaxID=2011161 RepID=A0A914X129_9BILA
MTSLTSNGNGGGHSPSKSPLPPASGGVFAPGTEVVATASFNGAGGGRDLPFRKDEFLRIVDITQDPNWYIARSSHGEGLIPANCVRPTSPHVAPSSQSRRNGITPMPWLHGLIMREEAERMLTNKPDGTFLVRESTNYPGDYTLCMAFKGKTEHYRIYQQKPGKFTCDDEEFFDNLTQLISHYKRDADGLCHRLVTPIIPDNYMIGRDEPDIALRSKVFRDEGLVIRRHELSLGDIVGHGEFGDVRSGTYKRQKVAVKVLKRLGVVDSLLEEAQFMASLRHKNLVQLIGVVLDDTTDLFLVTEFMANGNLVDFLRSRGRHQVERRQLIQFALDICEGMAYLESKQLVHRDLAARNVLLAEDMTAKISDFGLAKHANSPNHDTSSGKFPIKWTAPESLRTSKFSNKSDMWSFGVLLWEIYSFGRVPYPRIPIQDVIRHIEKGYRMEAPEGCPAEISKLMNEAWAFKPEDRPNFIQMLAKLKMVSAASSPPPTPTTPSSKGSA